MVKISLFVAKITFVVAEMTFKVTVVACLVIKFLGADIRLLVTKINFVAAEIIFKDAVITSSMANITIVVAETTEITF